MFLSAVTGFFIGILVPAIAGRFGKILPADPGHVILHLWHHPRFPKVVDVPRSRDLYAKWKKLVIFSLLWGIILAGLFSAAEIVLPVDISVWGKVFITLVCFSIVVDSVYCLLPDFFTFPILILGFGAGILMPDLTPISSFFGAVFGYLVAVIAVMLLGVFLGSSQQSEIGAGDVKMMAGLGAWLGIPGLNFTLMLSFFLFAIPATIRTQKQGPYGPALGIAAIITFFLVYMK